MRKRTYSLLLGLGIGIMIAIISSVVVYYVFGVRQVAEMKREYENLTRQYREENMMDAYMVIRDIPMDNSVDISFLEKIKLPSKYEFRTLIQSEEELEGALANVDISTGAILHREMIGFKSDIPDDLREFELQGLQMPINMKHGDYVDVRVSFPSGLDFLVLSKKKVIDILKVGEEDHFVEYCIFNLDTDEILRLKSAIVDAYINEGTHLYSTIYVEPDKQKAAEITYPVNENVRKIIQDDPNIVKIAMKSLDEGKRKILDESLSDKKENVDWNRETKGRESLQGVKNNSDENLKSSRKSGDADVNRIGNHQTDQDQR